MPIQYSKSAKKAQGTKVVQKLKDNKVVSEETTTENVTVTASGDTYKGTMGTVAFGMGATLNMGEFSSVKLYVSLSLPCAPNIPAADATFDTIKEWVESKTQEAIDEVQGEEEEETEEDN